MSYGQPKTFTFDAGQMYRLFELLDPLFKTPDGREKEDAGEWECLRALRNDLHRQTD